MILGPELAQQSLLPAVDVFLKDLDEVMASDMSLKMA